MLAIRGAITVDRDEPGKIYAATERLISTIIDQNKLAVEDIVSIIFSCTQDLSSAYPARQVREMGIDVPLFCLQEMAVQGSLKRVIRVLLHIDRNNGQKVKHIYLEGAQRLRPDLMQIQSVERNGVN